MSRLTFKDKRTKNGIILPSYCNKYQEQVFTKLGQLEDLEEELGYDLIPAKNLIGKNVWVKVQEDIIERPVWFVDLSGRLVVGNAWSFNDNYKLKDYGKTWALTIEELEHSE